MVKKIRLNICRKSYKNEDGGRKREREKGLGAKTDWIFLYFLFSFIIIIFFFRFSSGTKNELLSASKP